MCALLHVCKLCMPYFLTAHSALKKATSAAHNKIRLLTLYRSNQFPASHLQCTLLHHTKISSILTIGKYWKEHTIQYIQVIQTFHCVNSDAAHIVC